MSRNAVSRSTIESWTGALLAALALTFAAPLVVAQPAQQNSAAASLVINGTGAVHPSLPAATNSSVYPTPAGSLPLYHHDSQARSTIELRVTGGTAGAPVIVVAGQPLAGPIPFGSDVFHLSTSGLQIVVNGYDTSSLTNAGAILGATLSWSLLLAAGLPPGFPTTHFQAAVADPASPTGLHLTGAVTLRIMNDLPTATKNLLDAIPLAHTHPLYLLSLLAADFLQDGFGAVQFLADNAIEAAARQAEGWRMDLNGIGPNTPSSPAPPGGGPAFGQNLDLALDVTDTYPGASSCGVLPLPGERFVAHDFGYGADLAAAPPFPLSAVPVWKCRGNQRLVEVEAEISFHPGSSNPQGLDVVLEFEVEDIWGHNGGIASVTVQGPQLQGVHYPISGIPEATSAQPGSLPLQFQTNTGSGAGSEWSEVVQVARTTVNGQPSASRWPQAWVPGLTVANPDVYTFTINWIGIPPNPPPPPSVYSVTLRCGVDPGNPAAVLAAIPAGGSPFVTGVLTGAGAPGATLALSFASGAVPNPQLHSDLAIEVIQNLASLSFETDERLDGAVSSSVPLAWTLCVPGLLANTSTAVIIGRNDVYGNSFDRVITNLTF